MPMTKLVIDYIENADCRTILPKIGRSESEAWNINALFDLAAIETAIDEALADADLKPGQIDKVFLTGGSSFVPAVRALFHARFAPETISSGAELESIAAGLALIGGEADLDQWCRRAGG